MDRLQLLLEADKRGLLPPEQKVYLDEAIRRGIGSATVEVEKPASVSVGEQLMQIPRQLGLTARYGAEGLADVAQIGTEPIRAVLNPVLRAVGLEGAPSLRATVSSYLDKAGLPNPENANERVVGDASRLVAGAGGLANAASKGTQFASGLASKALEALAANPTAQIVSGATAGAAGGSVREAGGGAGAQFAASLAGGLAGAGATALGQKLYTSISDAVQNFMRPKMTPTEVNITLNTILEQNGIDVSKLGASVRTELTKRVQDALNTGKPLDPAVIQRIADYGVVGATPTRGNVTLDPGIITRERNLAKLGANSTDPNLQQLSQVQNANNATLIRNMNELGAGTANANPTVAGQRVIDAIAGHDAAWKSANSALYKRAEDAAGRRIEIDPTDFVHDAYRRVSEARRGSYLPAEVKSLLENLRVGTQTGPDGQKIRAALTPDAIDEIKTILAGEIRSTTNENVKRAVGLVYEALNDVNPFAVGRAPTGGTSLVDPQKLAQAQSQANQLSKEAIDAFDAARSAHRARSQWRESAQGIKAALDEPNADRFVQDFIISRGNKSSTAEVEKMLHTLGDNGAAKQAIKEHVLAYLKGKALNGNADEVGNFSASGFQRALNEIGDLKLRLFFSKEEIAQLKAVGRVASYETVQPRGSAVNNSNTAATLGGWASDILSKIAESKLISRIPFGDQAIRQPALNWSQQIGAASALDPFAAIAPQLKGQSNLRLSDLIAPGLVLAAPKANSGNN